MNENIITVTGNLCTKPEVRQTRSGAPMLTFRVASTHRYFSNRTGQWEEGVANFYDVVAYRHLAFNAGKSLSIGDAVILQGQLKQRRYDRQDGTVGTAQEIEARLLGPDLAYGIATFLRAPRPGRAQDNRAQSAAGQGAGGQGSGGQGAGGPADPWVDPQTGEVRGDAPIDPDSVAYNVDKDEEATRLFPPRTDADDEGLDGDDELEDARESELVGAD